MTASTRGRRRKGIAFLLHRACSIVLAACMALTLVPAAAWATAGSGSADSDVGGFDGNSKGSTEVKGLVRDSSFKSFMVPGDSFENVDDLISAIEEDGLQAVFSNDALPDDFTVTWYVVKMAYQEQEGKEVDDESSLIAIATKHYEGDWTGPWSDGLDGLDGGPLFKYTGADDAYEAGWLSSNDLKKKLEGMLGGSDEEIKYRFSISLKDNSFDDEGISASGDVSVFKRYRQAFIASGTADDPGIIGESIEGFIYRSGSLFNLSLPELETVAASESVKRKLNEVAQKGSELVSSATDYRISYGSTNLPDGVDPYKSELTVAIPLPEDISGVEDGDTVSVYIYNEDGTVDPVAGTVGFAKDPDAPYCADGSPNYYLDEEKNSVAVAYVEIKGTGLYLGSFGVGIPVSAEATYTIKSDAGDYGSMVPSGSNAALLTTVQTFSAHALAPGYVLNDFTLKVNGGERDIASGDVSLNSFTFDPQKYGIKAGYEVEVSASFSMQEASTVGSHVLTVELKADDGASGSVAVTATDGSSSKTIGVGERESVIVPIQEGAILGFAPNATDPVCCVKSVEILNADGSMSSVAFEGSSLMIGALSADATIVVTYARGASSVQLTNSVDVSIPDLYGSQPAWMEVDDGSLLTEYSYSVASGNGLTIKTSDDYDYDLVKVVVTHLSTGTKQTAFSKLYDGSVPPSGYENPDVDTLVRVSVTSEPDEATNRTDTTINIYNVVEDLSIELIYMMPTTDVVDGSTPGYGGGSSWLSGSSKSTRQLSRSAAAVASYSGVSAYSDSDSSGDFPTDWDFGEAMQFSFWAADGYTVKDLTVNNESILYLATLHDDGMYTITFYKGYAGLVDEADIAMWYGEVQDKVYYFSSRYVHYTLEFEPVTIPTERFYTVSTSVSNFGHGSVTPSAKIVEGGRAPISFFPDDGYKVQSVLVDGVDIYADGWTETDDIKWVDKNRLGITISNITGNVQVVVSFAEGKQPGSDKARYTVTATAGEGGSISPEGSYQVYEGESVPFLLVPNTGYEVSAFTINGEDKLGDVYYNNTYTVDGVTSDLVVSVEFKRQSAGTDADYHEVWVSVVEDPTLPNNGGTVSPSGRLMVPDGGNLTLTLTPEPGYKVGDISVGDLGGGLNSESKSFGTSWSRSDITSDMKIRVTFVALEDGETGDSAFVHEIKATSSVGGSISPEGAIKVADGASSTYTFVPDYGYKLSYAIVDGADVPASYIRNHQYTFTEVSDDHTIHAVFIKSDLVGSYRTVMPTAGKGGSVSPDESFIVKDGASASIAVDADTGCKISGIDIVVDGDTCTLSNVSDLSDDITGVIGKLSYVWSGSDSVLSLSSIVSDVEVRAWFESMASERGVVNVTLAGAQLKDADGNLSELDLSNVVIGTGFDSDGVLVPINRDKSGVLLGNDGQAMEFVQGAPYTFFVSASDADGSELLLVSATYGGAELSVSENDNAIYSALLSSSEELHLVFAEMPVPVTTYTITAIAGANGKIIASGVDVAAGTTHQFTVPAGGSLQLSFEGDEGYTVDVVKVDGLVDMEAPKGCTFVNVDEDHTIEVSFTQTKSGDSSDRLVKTASSLAKTGDLTGPAIGFFLLIAGIGIGVMAISMIRSKRRTQRNR